MKSWVVVMINRGEPEHKVYLVGAHSSKEAAKAHIASLQHSPDISLHLVDMDVDARQPPVLVGVERQVDINECKKNTPNG